MANTNTNTRAYGEEALVLIGSIKGNEKKLAVLFADVLEHWANPENKDGVEVLKDFCEAIRTSGDQYLLNPINSIMRKLSMAVSLKVIEIHKPTAKNTEKVSTYSALIRINEHFFDYRVKEDKPEGETKFETYKDTTDQKLYEMAMEKAAAWLEREAKRIKRELPEDPAITRLNNLAARARKSAK